jgi:hypothetical protein
MPFAHSSLKHIAISAKIKKVWTLTLKSSYDEISILLLLKKIIKLTKFFILKKIPFSISKKPSMLNKKKEEF